MKNLKTIILATSFLFTLNSKLFPQLMHDIPDEREKIILSDTISYNFGKGTFLINPEEFEIPSYSKIELISEKDTLSIYSNHIGLANYNLELNEPQKEYLLKISPTQKGDDFIPYERKIKISSGQNPLIILKR